MIIPKVSRRSDGFERSFIGFETARAAFRAVLRAYRAAESGGVLLPAYVGWSPREGSGVLDPVRELDVPFAFYRMDARLHVDLAHLRQQLERRRPRVVLVIHYFGVPDPRYPEVVSLAREYGAAVIEDEAHAMLTDLVAGTTGRLGDASLVSLHKLLPVATGGGLIVNASGRDACAALTGDGSPAVPWTYDLAALANVRRRHARRLAELVAPLRGAIDPLWELSDEVVPQTYPVLVRRVSRDALYEAMNAAGFGVVSLYHTLVDSIDATEFSAAFELSRTILNLPVHQEATEQSLADMVRHLATLSGGAP